MKKDFNSFLLDILKQENILPYFLENIDKLDCLPSDIDINYALNTIKSLLKTTKNKDLQKSISLSYVLLLSKFTDFDTLNQKLSPKFIKQTGLELDELKEEWTPSVDLYFSDIKIDARLELIRAYLDSSYMPNIKELAKYTNYTKKEQKAFEQIISFIANDRYQNNNIELSKKLLQLLDDSYQKYWNLHVLDSLDNFNIIYLVEYIKDPIIILELKLKYYENLIDSKTNWDYIDLSEEITKELSKEISAKISDELLSKKYLEKLYTKALFLPINSLFKTLPKDINSGDKIAIYKSFKRVFGFLKDQNIKKTTVVKLLAKVDKFLFKELKDEESAISFLLNSFTTENIDDVIPNLQRISILLREDSLASDMVLETVISSAKQLITHPSISTLVDNLKKLSNPIFVFSGYILESFIKTEAFLKIPNILSKNQDIFSRYPQLFYMYLTEIFSLKSKSQDIKRFISTVLLSKMDYLLVEQCFFALLNYFYEQPYVNFIAQFDNYTISNEDKIIVSSIFDKFIMNLLAAEDLSDDFEFAMPKFIEFSNFIIRSKCDTEQQRSI